MDKSYSSYRDLPLTLRVEDLQSIFGIGRNKAYDLVNSGRIRSIKIGRQLRIPKQAVIDYIESNS